ncbi:MAG: hypothetical protein NVSMB24_26310 [Mucilaginibacter sp.]
MISIPCFAQTVLTAEQAYDHAQSLRRKAMNLWGKDQTTSKEVEAGIKILNDDVHFLDSLPVKRLAAGYIYLKARRHDVYFDLVMAYCIDQQKEKALGALEKMIDEGSYFFVDRLANDSVFTPIRSDPRFINLINKLKDSEALWTGPAFKTPLKINLSEEEKVAGLSLLWSQAKYNFVYFDHVHLDWNQTYFDYLSKVRATSTTIEYYKVLQKFYAQLQDGHTNVYPPKALNKEFYSRPPIRTELIDGRVFVTAVFSDSLQREGIKPGLEILKINSKPVIAYADQNIKPYQSSSTPQDLVVREFSYFLLSGPESNPLMLQLKDNKGKIQQKTITRTGYHDIKITPALEYKSLGNIGYLIINNFENDKIIRQFDSLFTQITQTKGLIIDIRNNGGGDSYIGDHILSSLTNKSFKTEASKILKYTSMPFGGDQWDNNEPGEIEPNRKLYYDKPVILLISAKTFSAAEDFTVSFDYMKRGKMIGQTTGGSTGQPISFDLPGGGSARICGKRATYPDGKEFVGIGIKPDIEIPRTSKEILSGDDSVLKVAIRELKQTM